MLTVEDGTGYSNADSYATVEFADTYHAARGNTVWADLSPERKEQLLRRASDYTTYIFGNSFIGKRAYTNQSLAWPRYNPYDPALLALGVPVPVQEAVVELALVANTTGLMPGETSAVRKKSIKVGPISIEYADNGYTGPRFVAATSRFAGFLAGLASSPISTARLVRT